jgi:hypothetical protein
MIHYLLGLEFDGRILVGLGALLAGIGSALTGYAAIKKARQEGIDESRREDKTNETTK